VLVGELQVDSGEAAVTKLPLSYAPPPHPKKEGEAGGDDAAAKDDEEEDEAAADAKALDEALLKAKLERLAALSKEGASAERCARRRPFPTRDPTRGRSAALPRPFSLSLSLSGTSVWRRRCSRSTRNTSRSSSSSSTVRAAPRRPTARATRRRGAPRRWARRRRA